MSTTVYDGELHGEIFTKDVLITQLEKAVEDLRKSEGKLFCFSFAGISIEIDGHEDEIHIIA
jgi:hypothetical protein